MAGVILTLLAIVAAIGFALNPGDALGERRGEWRDSVLQEIIRIRLPQNKLQGEGVVSNSSRPSSVTSRQ